MKFISNDVTRHFGRTILQLKKNSPHIFFAGGLAGQLVGTFLACKATLKLEPVLDEIKGDLEQVKADPKRESGDQKEYLKDLGYVYGKSAMSLVKLYGPSVVVIGASTGALTGSHIQLNNRNHALTALAAATSKAYDNYRDRVREELGAEKELELHRALETKTVTIDGKKEDVKIANPEKWSIYARIFDDASPNWQKDPELNRMFLQGQQNYANHLLQSRGHVFLNEVYDALGLERSRAGAVTGWVMGNGGDDFIDFGIMEAYNARFVNNMERSLILDFNVDGVVYDLI